MNKIFKSIIAFFLFWILSVIMGYNGSIQAPSPPLSPILGIWRLEKIVLVSDDYEEAHHRMNNRGGVRVYREDYLGYEIEYTEQYVRLGDWKYIASEYSLWGFVISSYLSNGSFWRSDFEKILDDNNIDLDKKGEYEDLGDIPIDYVTVSALRECSYRDGDDFPSPPVGDQCLLLNKDTMLVGVWGKIILARRVK
ncbi:MAG: hypothetical protein FWH04_07305 [Oscillospiraceae bacterium]|nr:hypothetical protein [Oscillospiraceae bacterium]